MNRKKLISLAMAAMLLIAGFALAESPEELTDEERIAALEIELAEKNRRIDELEALVQSLGGQFSDFDDADAAAEFESGIITVEQARAEFEYRAYYYDAIGLDSSDYAEIIKRELIEGMVEDAILQDKAEEYGLYQLSSEDLEAIQEEAEAAFEENVQYYMVYRSAEGKTDDEIRQETIDFLSSENYTLDGVIDTLVSQIWRDRLREYIVADVEMTDAALEQYYQDELMSAQLTYSADPMEYEYARLDGTTVLWNPEGYRRVKAILIGFDDDSAIEYYQLIAALENTETDAERAALLEQIDALYAALDPLVGEVYARIEAGDDFMLLVDEYSTDAITTDEPTRSTGYFVSEDSLVYTAAFAQGAMALANVGDVSEPIAVDSGVYILKYEADVPAGAVAFEDVKDELAEFALESLRDRAYNDMVSQWLEEANIIYHLDRF